MKTVEKTTKTGVKYAVKIAETLEEALGLLGLDGLLQAVNYVLGVRAAKKATAPPSMTVEDKEMMKVLRKDKGLREVVMKEMQKKSTITIGG